MLKFWVFSGISWWIIDGFGGQWIDREGKTPLIVACMNPGISNVAKTLIELGANVNAYRPGMFYLILHSFKK